MKLCFFIRSLKNQTKTKKTKKREAGTNFVLLCQSRNMVGQTNKVYLRRSTKILHFSTPARIQKCLTWFSFFNKKPTASWVAHIQRDFLTCYSCSYYSSTFNSRDKKASSRCRFLKRIYKSMRKLGTVLKENEIKQIIYLNI